MKKHVAFAVLLLLTGLRCTRPNQPDVSPIYTPEVVSPSTDPAIVAADVDGVGKAVIAGHSVIVKLPADYTKSTVRIVYKVTAAVTEIFPASGSTIPVRGSQPQTVCIQNNGRGQCTLSYQVFVETASPLTIATDANSSMRQTRFGYSQQYGLDLAVGNLKPSSSITRTFRLRLIHKTTGYFFLGQSTYPTLVTGSTGRLRLSGTFPPDMPVGEYSVSIQAVACQTDDIGRCVGDISYEWSDLTEPFVLVAGEPVVGQSSLRTNNTLVLKGVNFDTAKPLSVSLTNDFTAFFTGQAVVQDQFTAVLAMPATFANQQFRLDLLPSGGTPYRALLPAPSSTATRPIIGYVGRFGTFRATPSITYLSVLTPFEPGDMLEIDCYPPADIAEIRLVSVSDTAKTYALTAGKLFFPTSLVGYVQLWQGTIPTDTPKGDYGLVVRRINNQALSLPYYQKIRVN